MLLATCRRELAGSRSEGVRISFAAHLPRRRAVRVTLSAWFAGSLAKWVRIGTQPSCSLSWRVRSSRPIVDRNIDLVKERLLSIERLLEAHVYADHFTASHYLKTKLSAL